MEESWKNGSGGEKSLQVSYINFWGLQNLGNVNKTSSHVPREASVTEQKMEDLLAGVPITSQVLMGRH